MLESRIGPAALNAAGTVLTYTDIDGDFVKVAFSHATMAPGDFAFSPGSVNGDTTNPQSLALVNLTGKAGAGFTLVATPHGGKGDSHANVGGIAGAVTDLGSISVDGDVGILSAGSGTPGKIGLKSFTALSMGRDAVGGIANAALRNIGSFTVKGDIVNEQLSFTGGVKALTIGGNLAATADGEDADLDITGNVGAIKIGGSLIGRSGGVASLHVVGNVGALAIGGSVVGGSTDLFEDQVTIDGNIKTLNVAGDLLGGAGRSSAFIQVSGTAGTVKIGGSIFGNSGDRSGGVEVFQKVGSLIVGGSLIGGSGDGSAQISPDDGADTIRIGGSVLGGPASSCGLIFLGDDVNSISIGHNLAGANYAGNTSLLDEGAILSVGSIGRISIGGDFSSGRNDGVATLTRCGMIGVDGTIGSVKIGGSILGDPSHLAYITAGAGGTTGAANAIASISVKGSVQSASLLAGYDFNFTQGNIDSGIGSVSIGGNLSGSYIIVGSNKGGDNIPGNSDDVAISSFATIGSVKVGGAFTGLAGSGTNYYIYAPIIKKLAIGRVSLNHAQLHAGIHFDSIGHAIAFSVD